MQSTSPQSSVLDIKVIETTSTTRKIIRPEIVANRNDEDAGVKITIAHQRKGRNDNWTDISTTLPTDWPSHVRTGILHAIGPPSQDSVPENGQEKDRADSRESGPRAWRHDGGTDAEGA